MSAKLLDCKVLNFPARPLLGQVLVQQGAISRADLRDALALRERYDCLLTDILLNRGLVSECDLMRALAVQWRCPVADFTCQPPDPALFALLPPERWIELQAVPWRRTLDGIQIATARPDQFHTVRLALPASFGPVTMALAQRDVVLDEILRQPLSDMVTRAETRVADHESCRGWDTARFRRGLMLFVLCFLIFSIMAPALLAVIIGGLSIITLTGTTLMKSVAALCSLRHVSRSIIARDNPDPLPPTLPPISILVPLYKEKEIASHLIRRLQRLTYPKELLDICLVVEADDDTTRQVIAKTRLPRWMRVITVPRGGVRTKPRAMNFALPFCRGDIIGVYDAEDAPDPDQISQVVSRFHRRGSKVACLQGVLDYYNARTNWLSRCFTIEYAMWFRVVLPGLQRLGLILPLGGTTLFIRRSALEQLGAWDAHNVTEDADLGIRLARHGFRTEFVPSTTGEEANCRIIPWIRQRSRWLKGFAMTWSVHMRNPRLLIRQVGWWRFVGLQLLLPCALGQVLLAPLLWSLWLIPLGLWHPVQGLLPAAWLAAVALLFLVAEVLNMLVNLLGVTSAHHRHLRIWVPLMHFYYPLNALAAYKALYEMLDRPFYWDKTGHGLFAPTEPAQNP